MTRRSFDQYCGVARALEIVGDRWTLLVVRELLTGPKRFSGLQDGVPGMATNLLSDRLRTLAAAGVLVRDADGSYRLTDRGRALGPVVLSLADWGAPLLGPPKPDEHFRLRWLLVLLESRFRRGAVRTTVTIELRVGPETLHVVAGPDAVELHEGPATAPHHVIGGSRDMFLAWATGRVDDTAALALGLTSSSGATGLRLTRRLFGDASGAPPAGRERHASLSLTLTATATTPSGVLAGDPGIEGRGPRTTRRKAPMGRLRTGMPSKKSSS